MTIVDFIAELFCRVDEALGDLPKHPQAKPYPSEVVMMALLFALKGGGEHAFCCWLDRASWCCRPSWVSPTATASSCCIRTASSGYLSARATPT